MEYAVALFGATTSACAALALRYYSLWQSERRRHAATWAAAAGAAVEMNERLRACEERAGLAADPDWRDAEPPAWDESYGRRDVGGEG